MSLIDCPECKKEISNKAKSCIHCGMPMEYNEPVKSKYIPYSDQEVSLMLSKKKKTGHVLHLLLTVMSFGLWAIIWWPVSSHITRKNKKIDDKILRGRKVK